MNAGGPRTGTGGIILKILPPAPYKGRVLQGKTRPAPPRNEHYINWIPGFLKQHAPEQAIDDTWKALPPCPDSLSLERPSGRLRRGKETR